MLSKEASSTIFWVFALIRPGIELQSPGPLTNTLPTMPMGQLHTHAHTHIHPHVCLYMSMYMYIYICVCVYMYVWICIYVFIYIYIYINLCYIYVCVYIYIYIYVNIYIHIKNFYGNLTTFFLYLFVPVDFFLTSLQSPRYYPSWSALKKYFPSCCPKIYFHLISRRHW